ncbi:hypothetical protein AAU61_06865 [Desulfocarbo indianensis]|nr:hypothetical protein AAU61_06865 [Desulfocarbo indianensis]
MMIWRKICFALAALAALGLCSGAALADENPFRPKAPFKSAIVHYKHQGSETGQSTLYYKGQDTAEYKDTSTTVWGMNQGQEKTITITRPKEVIVVDLVKKEGMKTGNQMAYMAEEYEKLNPAEKARVKKNAEKMGQSMLGMAQGGQPQIREGQFMGKPVQITSVMGLTSYVWKDKGVLLKQEGSLMGIKMDTVATKVEVGVPVPGEKLQPPPGIKVVYNENADQEQRKVAKQVMEMLKDPDFGKGGGMAAPPAQGAPAGAAQGGEQPAQSQEADPVKEGLDTMKKLFNW